jgi:hypothetical protein
MRSIIFVLALVAVGCSEPPTSPVTSPGTNAHPAFTYRDPNGRRVEIQIYVAPALFDTLGAIDVRSEQATTYPVLYQEPRSANGQQWNHTGKWYTGHVEKGPTTIDVTGWKDGGMVTYTKGTLDIQRDTAIVVGPF